VRLDVGLRTAMVDGRQVELTPREFTLLETLSRHAGQVMSRGQLLSKVWGYSYDPTSNVVDVYVDTLSKKLGGDVIETVRGAGYRLRTG
jgi:DNA-binding response OmpR family regulator